ncbi:oxidoreductase [Xylaria arbuscula]|nr:oxidoreductase [Xylaria arbuscula]
MTTSNLPIVPKRTDSGIAMQEQQETTSTFAEESKDRQNSAHMLVSEAILARHSSRIYLPQPVPQSLLTRALELARHSPSNTNTQPWRLFIVTGDALSRLNTALLSAAEAAAPAIPPPPAAFQKYHSALGRTLYGEGYGLSRSDTTGRKAAVMRNYEFFGAPVGIVVCMSAELVGTEALSVGMYVQTLLLALTDLGLGSCVEISIAGYPEVVRREVGIGEEGLVVLCGIAVGFEDLGSTVNRVVMERDGVEASTVWVR